ncbi:MAG: hemerythrin domain-containing protein [Candidatus Binatia bacterium]
MPNATQMLRQDHKKVNALFDKFEQGKAGDAKRRLAKQAMNELKVHAQVEEEIFYPAVKKAIDASELVDEAEKEHQAAKSLISQLEKAGVQDNGEADFDAKFTELMQAIQHHVEEEEGEMFPQVEDSELDLAALGARMMKRKQELSKGVELNKPKSATRSKSPSKAQSTGKTKSRSKTASGSARKRARAR